MRRRTKKEERKKEKKKKRGKKKKEWTFEGQKLAMVFVSLKNVRFVGGYLNTTTCATTKGTHM